MGKHEPIYFIGAGPGDPELLTIRGKKLIDAADIIVYTGSLVDASILADRKSSATIYNSAHMHLDDILDVLTTGYQLGQRVVRVHTGDPSIYGAIREQMDRLDRLNIPYQIVPGVSSFLGAAAAVGIEYTLPEISQTVILTRQAGRTPVPEREKISVLASHQATMVIFLSVQQLSTVVKELKQGGYPDQIPVAVVYRATWADEQIVMGDLTNIVKRVEQAGIRKHALIIVGRCLGDSIADSKLYDRRFTHAERLGETL